MIARLAFLIVSLAALVTWLAWPDAPASTDAPVKVEPPSWADDFDPLVPPHEATLPPTRTSADPSANPTRTIQADPAARGRNEGVLTVRIEGANDSARWMVHVEDGRLDGQRPLSLPAVKGLARIEALPLGGNYEVLAIDENAREPARRSRVEGPRTPGQVVDVLLRAPRPVELRARIVDESGTPITSSPIETLVVHGDHARSGQEWSSAVTDVDGYVVVNLPYPEGTAAFRALWARTSSPGAERRAGSIPLTDPLPRGETEVGVVRLAPEPLVASGRVVDAEGRSTEERGLVRALVVAKDGSVFAPNPPLVGRFGRDGVFAIHGFVQADEVLLRPMRNGDSVPNSLVAETSARVRVGASDVTLRYVAAGSIRGSLRLDPHMTPNELVVRIARDGEKELFSVSATADGSFEVSQLSPGLYRVRVTVQDDWVNPLVDVHDVVVASGETSRDARLANVDLRGRLRRMNLVFDRAMNLVPLDGRCRITRRDTATTWLRTFHGPSFELTLTDATYDLEIEYGTFAPVRLIDARGDQHLPLRRGRALVLRLVDPENLPPSNTATLRARLQPEGDEADLPTREALLSETRTRITNLTPGRWRVHLDLVRGGTGQGDPWSPIHASRDYVVEIPNEGDVEVEVDLDEVAVVEALGRLGD